MSIYEPSAYGYCEHCFGGAGHHRPGCPNDTSPPEIAGACDICGEAVYVDEDRYNVDGTLYHEECFNDKYRVTV